MRVTAIILGGFVALGTSGVAFAEAECLSEYGQTACGYHCVAEYGQVKCSRTPQGACMAEYGQVVCWDPAVRTRRHAECKAEYGKIACGYGCVAEYGQVKCSSSPEGVCRADYGKITCFE